jgi:hypothetical protein
VDATPGSIWFSPENLCTYEILDEPGYGPDIVLAVILTSARRVRGRYGACPLKGDRVYLNRADLGRRFELISEAAESKEKP